MSEPMMLTGNPSPDTPDLEEEVEVEVEEGEEGDETRPNFLAKNRNHDLAQVGVEWNGGGSMLVEQANAPRSAYLGCNGHGSEGVTPHLSG